MLALQAGEWHLAPGMTYTASLRRRGVVWWGWGWGWAGRGGGGRAGVWMEASKERCRGRGAGGSGGSTHAVILGGAMEALLEGDGSGTAEAQERERPGHRNMLGLK